MISPSTKILFQIMIFAFLMFIIGILSIQFVYSLWRQISLGWRPIDWWVASVLGPCFVIMLVLLIRAIRYHMQQIFAEKE